MSPRALRLSVAAAVSLVAGDAAAFGGGVSGRSGKTAGDRCSSCHEAGATALPTVKVTGPMTLAAGASARFAIDILGLSAGAAFDIGASAGALAAVDPGVTQAHANGDLSHTSAWPRGTTAGFEIAWTAPSEPGPATLFLGILNVNGDGGTRGDAEAYSTFVVEVSPPPDLLGADLAGADFAVTIDMTPLPVPPDMVKVYKDEPQWALACSLARGARGATRGNPPVTLFAGAALLLLHRRRAGAGLAARGGRGRARVRGA